MDKEKIEEAKETVKGLTVYYDDYCLLDEEEIEENDKVNNSIQLLLQYIDELEKENYIQRKQLNDAFNNGFVSKQKIKDKIIAHFDYEDMTNEEKNDFDNFLEELLEKW